MNVAVVGMAGRDVEAIVAGRGRSVIDPSGAVARKGGVASSTSACILHVVVLLGVAGAGAGVVIGGGGCAASLCADRAALPDEQAALLIGDSILWWNSGECQSIADHASFALGTRVRNASRSGARMLGGGADNPPIPLQVPDDGAWDVVVVDGGGNDLNATCGCAECGAVVDALVSADASGGAVPDLVDALASRGAHVLLVGYYLLPDGAWYGFDRCDDALAELRRRYVALASTREDDSVELFDFGDVVTPTETPDAYAVDRVHPAPDGSRLLGEALATRLSTLTTK